MILQWAIIFSDGRILVVIAACGGQA